MLTEKAVSNIFKYALTFDDLLLMPKYSDIKSRKEVFLSSVMGNEEYSLPIISSPMDTVTETEMAITMAKRGGLGIVHRYNTIPEQAALVREISSKTDRVSAAVGVTGRFVERAIAAHSEGAKSICIDVAHGHHSNVEWAIKSIKDSVIGDSVHLIAGNVAMSDGYLDLSRWGADAVRVGVGGGSICSTRTQTGHGVPTLQSVMACHIARGLNRDPSVTPATIIADGGIRNSGDIVKCLAAGADFAMLGSLLAGTTESPGAVFQENSGKKYKVYRGMASVEAQEEWRGFASSLEGVSTTIPYKGTVDRILQDMENNIKSGLSYSGARTIEELRKKCEFIIQTTAGQIESSTHIMRVR
tara:strand:+ start:45743 stop:46813 length:1071 start_codon:yes stop_codon:yes gene_type:complete